MSWGYFCDVALTVPSAEWKRIFKTKTHEHALPTPVFGFEAAALETMFAVGYGSADRVPNVALKDLPRWFKSYSGASSVTEDASAGTTTFRGTMIIDRGADPWIARTVAALLFAARATGSGHLALINDGSYSGESGVLLELANGAVTSARIPDSRPVAQALGMALFEGGSMPSPAELVALALGGAKKKAAPRKPVAKEPAPATAPAKTGPKTAVKKKAAAPRRTTAKKAKPRA